MIRFQPTWACLTVVGLVAAMSGCGQVDTAVGATDDGVLSKSIPAGSTATESTTKESTAAKAVVDLPGGVLPQAAAEPKIQSIADESALTVPPVKVYAAGESPRSGEDWPQFLGPRDNGVSGETGLLQKWPQSGPPIVWDKRVGTGYTAPSVLGNRLVLHHRLRDEEVVDCFTADTGKPLWHYAYPTEYEDPYGYNNGPRCSPILTADRCYTFGAEGRLLCLNLETGKKIWERDTAADWKIPVAFFGVGSSPVLFGKFLIAMVGGQPDAGVVAFDAETGKTVWQSVGKDVWELPERGYGIDAKLASYSSLIVARIHDQDFLFSWMRDGLVALNPADGKVRFSYFFRSRLRDSVNAACPVVIGDLVLLSAAYDTGAALLRIKPDGKSFDEVWKSENLQTHWSTTIHHQGYLYGFSGRHLSEGQLRCIDLKTGDIVWETDGLRANAPADDSPQSESLAAQLFGRGSAIMAEGKFIILGEQGLLALAEVNSQAYREISRCKLPRMHPNCWAAPVLSRQRLYLRSEDYLVCLDLRSAAK